MASRSAGLCGLLIAALALHVDVALAQMPAAVAAPGQAAAVTLHAVGAQIYDCKADKDGKLAWVFREPIATSCSTAKRSGAITPGRAGNSPTAAR